MCGLFVTNDPLFGQEKISVLDKRLAFRGPDFQSDIVKHGEWSIYHSRLSIIAIEPAFSQPYFTPSGGVLVFNGEILNYKALAIKYSIEDAVSDTEVLAILLDLEGFNFNELEGFFAFVFIDTFGNLRNVVRDRFGVKPLTIYKSNNIISISSEASVLSDMHSLDYSDLALEEFKVFRAPIFSGSYFKGVDVVEPGTCYITGEYFNSLSFLPEKFGKLKELIPELKYRIANSVKSRLVSDVPVGLLFSGGIDSNLIKYSSSVEFNCFTGGFSGDYDLEYARKSSASGSNVCVTTNEMFIHRFEKMVALRKEPLSVPNEVILSFLAESWRQQGGRVLLSGEAADEFFAGYERIFGWALKTQKFSIDEFLSFYAYVPTATISQEVKDHLRAFFFEIEDLSPFEKVRQFFVKKHLPVLFRRLDFALMFAGIEGREPLASTEIYKIALQFDPNDLFYRSLGKYPLRAIARDFVSDEFAFRPKVGFPIDIKSIMINIKSKDRYDNYSSWYDQNIKRIL